MHTCTVTSLHTNLHCWRTHGDQNWKQYPCINCQVKTYNIYVQVNIHAALIIFHIFFAWTIFFHMPLNISRFPNAHLLLRCCMCSENYYKWYGWILTMTASCCTQYLHFFVMIRIKNITHKSVNHNAKTAVVIVPCQIFCMWPNSSSMLFKLEFKNAALGLMQHLLFSGSLK